ncbi:hypothetical protein ACOI9Y_36360, partial [Mesorhizobium japonicum]
MDDVQYVVALVLLEIEVGVLVMVLGIVLLLFVVFLDLGRQCLVRWLWCFCGGCGDVVGWFIFFCFFFGVCFFLGA